MKKLLAILILCPLFFIASVSNSQNSKSLSSSYDGTWEGYAYTPEGRYHINIEIKNGIMSGFVEGTEIKGYINANNQLVTSPFYYNNSGTVSHVFGKTKSMSPEKIEGIYTTDTYSHKWYVVKAGTDKPEVTISNFQINENEPWTGKWKVESSSAGRGVWAMKQTGEIVKSTAVSTYYFRGKVRGNQLKGILERGSDQSFTMEMPPDAMSFKGTLVIWNRPYQLKGQRIE